MIVVLDANFMLLPFQFRMDIYTLLPSIIPGEKSIVTIRPVIDEIRKKIDNEPIGSTFIKQAKAALDLFSMKSNKIIEFPKNLGVSVDDTILNFALEEQSKGNPICVATNDKKLKETLLKNNIHVVIMRAKKTLEYI